MIVQRAAQQQPVLRAVDALFIRTVVVRSSQRRHAGHQAPVGHKVPKLTHEKLFKTNGVPKLLSLEGYNIAWTEYQHYLVKNLNRRTAHTSDESALTKTIAIKYARDPANAALFNYASMAHNNHLFFSTISPNPPPISEHLLKQITTSFSSLSSFRTTFLATATAMFGPGFVWLVRINPTMSPVTLAILTTYIAGSPYPGAHCRQQPVDMATTATTVFGGQKPQEYALSSLQEAAKRSTVMGSAGSFGITSKGDKKLPPGAQDLEVLMGVNTWEHVWLTDYGIEGKRQFLEDWWERVDWDVVEKNMMSSSSFSKPKSYTSAWVIGPTSAGL